MESRNSAIRCSIGNVLYDLKNYQKAISAYEIALHLDMTNKEAQEGMRKAMEKLA